MTTLLINRTNTGEGYGYGRRFDGYGYGALCGDGDGDGYGYGALCGDGWGAGYGDGALCGNGWGAGGGYGYNNDIDASLVNGGVYILNTHDALGAFTFL
jgi:hypothetical protein